VYKRQVLEFRAAHEVLEELEAMLAGRTDAVEHTGEAILAYTQDADALMAEVRESGIEVENTVYRHAGLEDVFLRLTGRSLIE
jgi:lipooligosaccharide transport system ATP-binding protein